MCKILPEYVSRCKNDFMRVASMIKILPNYIFWSKSDDGGLLKGLECFETFTNCSRMVWSRFSLWLKSSQSITIVSEWTKIFKILLNHISRYQNDFMRVASIIKILPKYISQCKIDRGGLQKWLKSYLILTPLSELLSIW